MTTSEPAAVRYMAPELLDPLQASLTRRNPPQECDIYSLAMTAFEVLPSHVVACVTNKPPLPAKRSSRMSCRMAKGVRVS